MNNNFILMVCLIAAISLSLTGCNSGRVGEPNQIATEVPSVLEATETPLPTELPPTETPIPPTETPEPTETAVPAIMYGDSNHFIAVGNSKRFYKLYIPVGLTGEEAVPVVFAFHGYYNNANRMRLRTGFNDIADRDGFVVVYPDGVEYSWNTSPTDPGYAAKNDIDDIAFVKAILSDLETMLNLDPKRIYATGYSMGGAMSYRLACEMSDTFAAVVSVGGVMLNNACDPPRSIPVIQIHGLDDQTVPFEGGGPFSLPPVQWTIDSWATINNCTEYTIQNDENPGIMHTIYSPCKDGITVELITVEGMMHEWPDFASETIWEFFAQHPMP